MDPNAGLETFKEKKISHPSQESDHDCLWCSHFTDRGIRAPKFYKIHAILRN